MKKVTLIFLLSMFFVSLLQAQESNNLIIKKLVICTSIEDHQPVGVDSTFSKDVGKLFCFSNVTGASDTCNISQVWYYKDEEMANIKLAIKAKTWRTWSSKKIVPFATGQWRVDVVSEKGTVLASRKFKVE
ncbi:MAG: DUF2914 domain-containing protein [Bacteroidales bacterium]|nr:DUF2914 domain-containing protein [Bacteroidales bacterium]